MIESSQLDHAKSNGVEIVQFWRLDHYLNEIERFSNFIF